MCQKFDPPIRSTSGDPQTHEFASGAAGAIGALFAFAFGFGFGGASG